MASAYIEPLVAQLFAHLGNSQDPAVTAYLAAGLAEDDEPDEDELRDTVSGFAPSFGALPPAQQAELIADLLRRVQQLKQQAAAAAQQQQQQPGAAAAGQQRPVTVAAVAAEALSRLSSLSVSNSEGSGADEEGCAGQQQQQQQQLSDEQQQAVAALRELCALAHPSDAFLLHLLAVKGGGDVEAAAAWMIECPDLAAAQLAWQQARQRQEQERQQAAQERQAAKKEIVERFQLQAVPSSIGGASKGKPPALKAWGATGSGSDGGKAAKLRYRDGMLVSSRGEKYIVEKGDEWDGGSRGKVYTKGKRGKGFV